jgi:hypothetical protein
LSLCFNPRYRDLKSAVPFWEINPFCKTASIDLIEAIPGEE